MTRHDEYKEGAWAIWPKDGAPNQRGNSYDTPEECVAAHSLSRSHFPSWRLVRLHRVSIEDVVDLGWAGNPEVEKGFENAMAKLGVALTERWVAAEEREIEPAAKVDEPRIFTKDMFKSIGEARDGDMILMPADPLLARLLETWSKISNMGRKCLVDDAIERKHWNPRKEGA